MAIELSPETEARLRQRAERTGQDADALADQLLADALAEDADELSQDAVAQIRQGIRRGLEAAAAGRERPLAEYAAQVKQRRNTAPNA
jgi:predicted transcriptional regulator